MVEKFKCAVIGAGTMGSSYIEIISRLRDTELVAVVEPDKKTRNKINNNYCTHIYNISEELFDQEDLDIVVISCPDEYHADAAVMALEKNIHVHLEKPVASSLNDCNKILKAAINSKAKINIGYILRMFPQYNYIRDKVKSGEFGNILHAYTRRNGIISEGLRWKGKNDLATYLVCHDADALMWITGNKIVNVYCLGVKKVLKKFGVHDSIQVLLNFSDSSIATIECSWAEPLGCRFTIDNRLDITGTKCAAFINLQDQGIHFYSEEGLKWVDMIINPTLQGYGMGLLKNEFEKFLDSVLNNTPVMCTVEEGIEATKVAIASKLSLYENRVVYLNEIN
jgi:predicted dehydrogenase